MIRRMTASYQRALKQLRQIHEEEDGMEAIQVVMIVAIAALILIAFLLMWDQIKPWFEKKIDELIRR